MKITKVKISATENFKDGLKDIHMDRLGSVVILAGKNGSGKSRILQRLQYELSQKPVKSIVEKAPNEIAINEKAILDYEIVIKQLQATIKNAPERLRRNPEAQLNNYTNLIKQCESQIRNNKRYLEWDLVTTDYKLENYSATAFVPKRLTLIDPNTRTKNDLNTSSGNLKTIGVNGLENTFINIQNIQDKWFNATHQSSTIPKNVKDSVIQDYERLKRVINLFLNVEIDRDVNGDVTIYGFPLFGAKLSDGQLILLQFCVAIFNQESDLKDLILFLDEPENHLHPSVILELLDKIQSVASNGQIWIATHSIPLLAHFDPSCIWFVEDGLVSHAGKTPEKVLKSLLGSDDEISKLQDFISLPGQFATSRYAFECLFQPEAVITIPTDPQPVQIRDQLLKLGNGKKLKVLEYGAGKGRVIANIHALDASAPNTLIDKLDYIAYDKFNDDQEVCKNNIEQIYGSSDKRYYNDMNDLLSEHNEESFHVVIMCNVLHEIDPNEWIGLFSKDGEVSKLLLGNGVLLLVEDHQMPIGEKAYQKGFIVLDTPQLKDLFNAKTEELTIDSRKEKRLKAHLIPKEYLNRINIETKTKALKALAELAQKRILEIRSDTVNYSNGKLHGFWTQQLANAHLNLSQTLKD